MKKIIEVLMELQLYATITNINTSTGYTSDDGQSTSSFTPGHELSIGMKTYYNTELLENARADLVYEQFARKQPLRIAQVHRGMRCPEVRLPERHCPRLQPREEPARTGGGAYPP